MMFPGESSITAGEFFQNHEKYTSRACPFLSWALVGRVTTHQKNISNPLRIPCLSNRCFKRLGCFKPSQRMIAGRHAADSRTEVLEKRWTKGSVGSWWKLMGVQVSVPTLKSFGTLHIFASFYIFNLDISDASGQMVIYLSVILTVNQNLQILAGARRDGISGGLSRRGLGITGHCYGCHGRWQEYRWPKHNGSVCVKLRGKFVPANCLSLNLGQKAVARSLVPRISICCTDQWGNNISWSLEAPCSSGSPYDSAAAAGRKPDFTIMLKHNI